MTRPHLEAITMLEKVKLALRITTTAYDSELTGIIYAALSDLALAGVVVEPTVIDNTDHLITQAVITFCKMRFGLPEDYDRLKRSYDEQKAQLVTATDYTDWGDSNV